MTSPIITFIGAGNMGGSLIGGLISNGHPADHIIATDPAEEKRAQLEKEFCIQTSADNVQAVSKADVVIFAVKPQIFKAVASPLANAVANQKPLIMSVAAGITINSMQDWLGHDIAVVRCMPNTPALIGVGATGLYANPTVSEQQHAIANDIMQAVGRAVWVQHESLLDTVTALSGSGPAYFFLVMEAMQAAAVELGLDQDVARQLTQQTALGAASMAIANDIPLAQLRHNVTSPGGTTEAGVSVLEKNKLREIFKQTLVAAKTRSEELAKEV